jgi:alpha-beta hydrolase superfamily lysophospholipase
LILSGPAVAVSPVLEALRDMEEIPDVPMGPLVSRDPVIVKDYETDPLNYRGPMPRSMISAFVEIAGVRDRLAQISLPILVMHGEADALVPFQASEDIAATVSSKDVTLKVWPELYHEILNEPEKDEVLAVIVGWLNAHV